MIPVPEEPDELVFDDDTADHAGDESVVVEEGIKGRTIFSSAADPTIKDLWERFKDGDLILQPEFQRYFIWDKGKSSRLIESVLLEVPLPMIYLAEESDGGESVIDGQQRLTSFFDYLDGKYPLKGLTALTENAKKYFGDLPKTLQARLKRTSLRVITIKKESDEELKFEIFERLNSGAVGLNHQELRNCVYRGTYNDALKELATNSDFRIMLNLTSPSKRMQDVELVLRFAAFFHTSYLNYRSPLSQFMNEDMRQYRDASADQVKAVKQAFSKSAALVRSMLGRNAFHRFHRGMEEDPNGSWEQRKFNASLYDILMYGFTLYEKNQIYPRLDAVREALLDLMTNDQDFIDSIQLSTSAVKMVTRRFDKWRMALEEIVGSPSTEPRLFSLALKQELFERDPTCRICKQKIQEIDDGAVDHIKQYWTGGKTIPDNARLTHRFCNWSRSKSDEIPTKVEPA